MSNTGPDSAGEAGPSFDETLPIGAVPEEQRSKQRVVGDYLCLSEIARGGMGIVYRAKQFSLNRIVALKMMRESGFSSELEKQRFRMEAEAAATLDHPNTVPIYEIGEIDGSPFYTMRLIEGVSLAAEISQGKWNCENRKQLEKAVRLIVPVAEAVHDAHVHGIVHRDLKPGNILLDESGVPYVADFGLAKRIALQDQLTQTGLVVGTPAYMSPEQASGSKNISTATDVYSLGAILYTLVTGKPPFADLALRERADRQLSSGTPSLRRSSRIIDEDLATICEKCLDVDPARRYSTAREFAEDLNRWLAFEPIRARRLTIWERSHRWLRRNPLHAAMAATLVLSTLIVMTMLTMWYRAAGDNLQRLTWESYTLRLWQAADSARLLDHVGLHAKLDEVRAMDSPDVGWELNFLQNKSVIAAEIPTYDRIRFRGEQRKLHKLAINASSGSVAMLDAGADGRARISIWQGCDVSDSESVTEEFRPVSLDWLTRPPLQVLHPPESVGSFVDYFGSRFQWSSDGRYLAYSCNQQTNYMRVWDMESGSEVTAVDCRGAFQWDATGRKLAFVHPKQGLCIAKMRENGSDIVRLAELQSGEYSRAISWTDSNSRIAVTLAERTVFFNAQTGNVDEQWSTAILAWNRDGNQWISGNGLGRRESVEPISRLEFDGSVVAAKWSPDDRFIGVSCSSMDGNTLNMFETTSGKRRWSAAVAVSGEIEWLPTGHRFTVGPYVTQDPEWTGKDRSFAIEANVHRIEASRHGTRLAAAVSGATDVCVFDQNGTKVATHSDHQHPVAAIDWNHDDSQVATLDVGGIVHLWSPDRPSEFREIGIQAITAAGLDASTLASEQWQIRISGDDRFLALSAFRLGGFVYDLNEDRILYEHLAPDSTALGWRESSDSALFVTGSLLSADRIRDGDTLKSTDFRRIIVWNQNEPKPYSFSILGIPPSRIWNARSSDVLVIQDSLGVHVEPMESSGNPRSVRFSQDLTFLRSRIQDSVLLDEHRIFVLHGDGLLDLHHIERKNCLLRLMKLSGRPSMAFRNDRLWVVDGTQITVFDGRSSVPTTVFATRVGWVVHPIMALGLIGSIFVGPIWLLIDRGIHISGLARILAATCACALPCAVCTVVLQFSDLKLDIGAVQAGQYFFVPLSTITIVGFVVELLRCYTQQRRIICFGILGFVSFVAIGAFAYNDWPGRTADYSPAIPIGITVQFVGLCMLAIRVRNWVNNWCADESHELRERFRESNSTLRRMIVVGRHGRRHVVVCAFLSAELAFFAGVPAFLISLGENVLIYFLRAITVVALFFLITCLGALVFFHCGKRGDD